MLVLTELWNAGSVGGDGHYVKTAGFLTGTTITKTTGKDLRAGGRVDGPIGRPRPPARKRRFPPSSWASSRSPTSLMTTSATPPSTAPTSPGARRPRRWRKRSTPASPFDRLFRTERDRLLPQDDRSILDLVADDANSLRNTVGKTDRMKLDEYFDSVRAVEKRIAFNYKQRAEENKLSPAALAEIEALDKRINSWNNPQRQQLARGVRNSGDHGEHVRLMLDLMVLGFWTDSTRVSTFMFGNGVSPKNFIWLDGVKGGHHEISHHKNDKAALDMYARINRWHVEQFKYMLDKMSAIKEGDGTLLDNSMLLFGSCMRDGNSHNPRNLPLVLAGKAGGTIKGGRHLVHKKNTPLCNLFVSMLDRMGTPVKQFGDSTGPLPGLDDPTYAGDGA
jgi:hypothetical protein